MLSYLPFVLHGGIADLGLPIAAILNTLVLLFLNVRLWTGQFSPSLVTAAAATAVVTYIAWCGILSATFPIEELSKWWPGERYDAAGLATYLALLTACVVPLWRSERSKATPVECLVVIVRYYINLFATAVRALRGHEHA